ncbi:Transcription factor bHLH99 [Cardamine amara subsp. amara]|uniref:Transcription factor bHLH99 n=1 Tax=Cardamine amara subsp. amara TaxID=228776 RepID=A0ABD0ZP21_CARAN
MMFQQEYPYGLSLIETSLNYKILDYFPNVIVSDSDNVTSQPKSLSSSSYSETLSSSIAEKSYSTKNLSTLKARGGSGDEPSQTRRKRRRTRSEITKEDKENQRMNHITVERNRRRQMNHFLSVLKSMMPLSDTQRCDQASIIEGTIDYLKKQEQLLQSFEAQLKATKANQSPSIFSDFFIFPQYSTASSSNHHHLEHQAAVADVEVTMVERHFNIKVLTKKRPRLLFKIINDFNSLGLSTLHLNLTTSKDMSLFTFSVKVEEDCQLTISVTEIANAVHEVVRRIHRGS